MFPTAAPEITYPRASDYHFAATWIGHATVLLQFGSLNILTDPIFSQRSSPVQWTGPRRVMDPALPIDKLPPVDVVLLSHNHYDHLDKSSVKRIAREHPRTTWFAGDTAYHPGFGEIGARCGPFDFVMIPIGAYEPRWFMRLLHLNPEEAVQVYQDLAAAHPDAPLPLMLGMHWGTFRLTSEPMDEPPRRAAARWRAAGLEADRLWIARFGETRVVKR